MASKSEVEARLRGYAREFDRDFPSTTRVEGRIMARIAITRGCARMEWSVLDWNEMALRVYRSVGARPLDEWTVQRLDGEALRALAAVEQDPVAATADQRRGQPAAGGRNRPGRADEEAHRLPESARVLAARVGGVKVRKARNDAGFRGSGGHGPGGEFSIFSNR